MSDQIRFRRISIALFFLTLLTLAIHMESIIRFNERRLLVHGNNQEESVRMEIDARKDSTSSWLKRSFPLDSSQTVDLIGQTIDGTLVNNSGATVQDWELRINIAGDCFVNQAWNGEVEIHQYVGTEKEKVQRLNLQNYELDDVTFEYRYDGDLLIPLQKGDFIFYYPSARFSETVVNDGDDVKIGMIFYYLGDLDLSDYDLTFHHHRIFTQGWTFYLFMILMVLFFVSLITFITVTLTYRRARKEMELRKSGIFSMSDIYDVIYIINLPTGEMTPVSVDEKLERSRPKDRNAKQLLTDLILQEADVKYRDMMLEFVDTDTLPERLKDRDSVVSEFFSKRYGWCSLRFYAMDRVEGKPLENVVFAVQDIDEEKKELEAMENQIAQAESASNKKSVFIDNLTNDFQLPLRALMDRVEQIMKECPEGSVHASARDAHSIAGRMLSLTEALLDSSEIQAGDRKLTPEAYSLRHLMITTLQTVLPLAEQTGTAVTLDVAETLPDHLRGDFRLLKEILVNLVSALLPSAAGGPLHISLYGKALNDKIHLLFSVRAMAAKDASGAPAEIAEPSALNLDVVSTLLTGIASSLRSVAGTSDRREYYFETEQEILDLSPVGKISVEDANE